jgi:predicted nucleotidyltransferase
MRLSKSEIKIIKNVACEVWGAKTMIYLFGSRTDDSKIGGDIDLFVDLESEQEPQKIMLQKAEFLSKLDIQLGEQKIDLLVKTPYNNHLPIIKTAQINGVAL